VCINENDAKKQAHKIAPVGGHALSNVQLPIYDGVNVMSGCIRHAEGWSGCRDGGHKLKGERFNESVWVFREKRGEGERLLRYGRRTQTTTVSGLSFPVPAPSALSSPYHSY
jgi:hypothetical protein